MEPTKEKKDKGEEKQRKKEEKEKKKLEKEQEKLKKKEEKEKKKKKESQTKEEKYAPKKDRSKRRTLFFFKKKDKKELPKSLTPELPKINKEIPSNGLYLPVEQTVIPKEITKQSIDLQTDASRNSASEEIHLLPKHVLENVLMVSTQIEKKFNFSEYQEEIDSFRMLNLNQIAYVGRDLYLSSLIDVLHLLPLIYDKEYARQLLFYSHEFDPEEILTDLVSCFANSFDSTKPQREKYCTNCVKIISSWLTTRGDTFTNEKLLLLVRDFVEVLKQLVTTNGFLQSAVDEVDSNLEKVFVSKGVVSIQKRVLNQVKVVGQEGDITFPEITILDEQCLDLIPEQLAIIEFMFLSRINPYDYYCYLDKQTRESSTVKSYIYWHNLISQWVAYEICRHEDIDKRYECITMFFQLLIKLIQKKNFNSFVSVMNGLKHQTVKRLMNTWNKLTKNDWTVYQDLESVQQSIRTNNSSITLQPPCVPDFMQQIERMQKMYDKKKREKNISSTNLNENNEPEYMIDLSKYARIGAVIDVLGTYSVGSNYKENKQMNEFFKSALQKLPLDDFSLLDLSLKVEPPQ
ncbi:RasGEF domain containing protein [Entamoeba histolytica HM-1:IMSS-B]|uniref:Ras-GEF domain-containing protein n=5 Tax=Entamoeba histolytica TaxID=5759 RepID=C4M967_ENTH1|nr:hypothetical protein EHI_135780 [Entamoeba histolytica HM-1:IMSS]EAL48614.2 hypothetical protein EHI_135780 [Entamoeba histolytica HM-1:IMSS]EMD48031.1 guanine nucleotide exchange factor, putative [Entamoeba histolytica KU27]EMH76001.1 RasGEF domain containing protein [Entamoeba histolytica HM-1:IMSS-B]GAT98188.1 hypothetical protein CL6EHI_135780 [Entamoeba histolytica]|eukprot:XP_654000.2 hypothetical protein EHI_135780 [Entamoeba histolytica HM-1:IMSS]